MRIHRLKLSNVKGVADREVVFPDHGVVVLEGPNEVGKTTLLEALDVLLEEKDSSRKRHVLAMRPVGRDVPTVVEAELSTGPYRVRYRKQWFRQPATELHVTTPRLEQLTGVAAHERMAAILAETTDQPLWRALRLMQAAPLTQVELTGCTALAAALDAAAESLLTDDALPGEDAPEGGACPEGLLEAVAAEVARYYTPGRGQPTGDYRDAIEAVAAATEAERCATQAVADVAADVERHEDLADAARRAAAALDAAQRDRAELQERWAEAAAQTEARDAAARDLETARRELERAAERHAARVEAVAALAARQGEVEAHRRAVAELAAPLAPDEATLADLAASREALAAAAARASLTLRTAELADRVRRGRAEAQALADRVARAELADDERRTLAADLSGAAIDEETVRRVERAATALDLARSQQEADSAHLTVELLADGAPVLVDGVPLGLAPGRSHELTLDRAAQIELPGALRLHFRPESGAAERGALVAAARQELAAALTAAGAADQQEARDRRDRCLALRARLDRATDRVADVLAGSSLEQLRDDLAGVSARLQRDEEALAAVAQHPRAQAANAGEDPNAPAVGEDPNGPASRDDANVPTAGDAANAPDLGDLGRRAEEAAGRLAEVAAREDSLRAAVQKARLAHTRAASLLGAADRELEASRARLARLREAEGDAALEALVAAAGERVDLARARLADAERSLGALDVPALTIRRQGAEAAADAAAARVSDLRDERLAVEARLEHSGRQGRYEALEVARGDLDHARRKLASVTRRAEAARLLHDTLQRHRAQTQRRYVTPFADALRRLGRLVYGATLDIEVSEALTIEARILDDQRIGYDALSTGAKEQLAILTRLAVATLVDPRDGVPVVIDDALGYSDPSRLRRMSAAFSLVGSRVQVILLTCTPGRYDGIVGAQTIALREPPGDAVRAAG